MKTKIALVLLTCICLYFAWLVPQEDKLISQWSTMAKRQAAQIDNLKAENNQLRKELGKDSVVIEAAQRPTGTIEVYDIDFTVAKTDTNN